MHSNGTLPLDTPLDARCGYVLSRSILGFFYKGIVKSVGPNILHLCVACSLMRSLGSEAKID